MRYYHLNRANHKIIWPCEFFIPNLDSHFWAYIMQIPSAQHFDRVFRTKILFVISLLDRLYSSLKGADDLHGLTTSITWGYKQLQSKMLEWWSLWSWQFPWLVEMLWWASGGIVSSSGTQGIFSSLKSQKLPDAVWCPVSTPERYLLNYFLVIINTLICSMYTWI